MIAGDRFGTGRSENCASALGLRSSLAFDPDLSAELPALLGALNAGHGINLYLRF